MEFRLTYEGELLAQQGEDRIPQRNKHVHSIRRKFHPQLKTLWHEHPILDALRNASWEYCNKPNGPKLRQVFTQDGFNWLPIVNCGSGLICMLDVLILRHGPPRDARADIDNRLKTVFDALRKPTDASHLSPEDGEDPFYVLLDDDKWITHVSVTSDMLLQINPNASRERWVRLVINVTVRPYHPYGETVGFA
jgi:hypothetical protein